MKITKHILAACILTGMAACDTDKEIAKTPVQSRSMLLLMLHIPVVILQEQMNSKCNLIMETRFC